MFFEVKKSATLLQSVGAQEGKKKTLLKLKMLSYLVMLIESNSSSTGQS